MAKQTALQELIDYIKKDFDWFVKHSPDYGVVPKIISKAESLLPKEREQIEEACNAGLSGIPNSAKEYFTQTYDNESE